jgi:hypothetical protein
VCESGGMAETVYVLVSTPDRERLEAITSDRNRQRKHVERARIFLAANDGGPVQRIADWLRRFSSDVTPDGVLTTR